MASRLHVSPMQLRYQQSPLRSQIKQRFHEQVQSRWRFNKAHFSEYDLHFSVPPLAFSFQLLTCHHPLKSCRSSSQCSTLLNGLRTGFTSIKLSHKTFNELSFSPPVLTGCIMHVHCRYFRPAGAVLSAQVKELCYCIPYHLNDQSWSSGFTQASKRIRWAGRKKSGQKIIINHC